MSITSQQIFDVHTRSLGVLLYTLVYGAMPFDGSNFKRLVKQISSGEYYEPPDKPSSRFTFLLACIVVVVFYFYFFTLLAFLRPFYLSVIVVPERCQAASPLVRHMLLVDPAKRANVEDICSHWYNHCRLP